MTRRDVYDDSRWPAFRARILQRDGNECLFAWLLGGPCGDQRHVHHVEPIEERPDLVFAEGNCITTCERHHPMLEALRRSLLDSRRREYRRCPHRHTHRAGREACERSLNAAA